MAASQGPQLVHRYIIDLSDYDIERRSIGKGAFGVVYRGYLRSDRTQVVAVKKLTPLSEDSQKSFMREVTIPARLHHP